MITISLNKTFDKEVFQDFWGFCAEGADFGEHGIKRVHPMITEQNFESYIDAYYEQNKIELASVRKELQSAVNASSEEYFSDVTKVFGKDYSDTTYTGLLSIFDCNPRYIDEKRFQVFYKRDLLGKLGVIYHEVLHFTFFEYAKSTCPEIVDTLDTDGGSFWALSEIFNLIILNQPIFQKVLKREEKMFYPMLADYVDPICKIYNENKEDFCRFLSIALTYLEDKRKSSGRI